jgi:hypothetical protein
MGEPVFSWDEWNRDHIARHDVEPEEAEYVVRRARPPFPREVGGGKFAVWGATATGRLLQVIFVFRSAEEVDFESVDVAELAELVADPDALAVYVVHSMDLTPKMKQQLRRLRRRK